jgi:preprotein translocase subunit YajC
VVGLSKILSFIISWLLIFVLALAGGGSALFVISVVLFAIYCWMVFAGGDKRALKARAKLDGALIKGETVVTTGIQMRVFALFSRRELIAITSSRLIQIKRSILGGFNMKDHQWKDLHDVSLSENTIPGLSGSKLIFTTQNGSRPVVIDGVPSAIATEIYSFPKKKSKNGKKKTVFANLKIAEQQVAPLS